MSQRDNIPWLMHDQNGLLLLLYFNNIFGGYKILESHSFSEHFIDVAPLSSSTECVTE